MNTVNGQKTVLVVDDSIAIRRQVARTLVSAGYRVTEAADGMEALDAVRVQPKPSLVLCDVNMPRMNGIEFLESFGRSNCVPAIPVVMLTTEGVGTPDLISRAKRAGVRGWIVKPFQADLLVAAVRRLLGD